MRSPTKPLPTKPPHGQSVQISRDPDQARTLQKRRSAALRRTHKSQISIAPALDPAGSFFGDFRTPAGVRNSLRQQNGSYPLNSIPYPTVRNRPHIGRFSQGDQPARKQMIVGIALGQPQTRQFSKITRRRGGARPCGLRCSHYDTLVAELKNDRMHRRLRSFIFVYSAKGSALPA